MTSNDLDVIMTHYWPRIVKKAMADKSDPWIKGFVLSIARHAKRPSWRPSAKQEQIMRSLLSDLHIGPTQDVELIER